MQPDRGPLVAAADHGNHLAIAELAAAIEEGRERCALLMVSVDRALAKRRFLAGDTFTMGDIPFGCHLHVWFNLPVERPAAPNAETWFRLLCERPAYRKIVMIPLS